MPSYTEAPSESEEEEYVPQEEEGEEEECEEEECEQEGEEEEFEEEGGGGVGEEEGGGEVEGAAVSAAGVALVRLGEAGAGVEAEAMARERAEGRDESSTGWGRWPERELPARRWTTLT